MWIATGIPSAPARCEQRIEAADRRSPAGRFPSGAGIAEAEPLRDLEAARAQPLRLRQLGGHRLAVVLARMRTSLKLGVMNTAMRPPAVAAAASCVSSMSRGGPGYMPGQVDDAVDPPFVHQPHGARDAVGADVRVDVDAVKARGFAGAAPPARRGRGRRRRVAAVVGVAVGRAVGGDRDRPLRAGTRLPPPSRRRGRARARTRSRHGSDGVRISTSGCFASFFSPDSAGFGFAARALQLDVDLQRLRAALAARPVGAADHPLVRLVAVLLHGDRVRPVRARCPCWRTASSRPARRR